MKIAYFDCIAGASGDMILGALLDAGLPESRLRQSLDALGLDNFELQTHHVVKNGFSAIKVDVLVSEDAPARHLPQIEAVVTGSRLPDRIKQQAIAIFRRMGQVEAGIHNTTLEHVHLHELGGIDTIVDVVGALIGLEELGIEQVAASPLPMGRGFVRGAHGAIPLPAPAALALLKGAPIVGSDLNVELVTPTGAALLSSLATAFGPIPPMTLTAIGYGAGGRDLPIPNVLRLLLGDSLPSAPTTGGKQASPAIPLTGGEHTPSSTEEKHTHHSPSENEGGRGTLVGESETLTVLETNIDDLNPELYEYVMARLFEAGALDVFLSPIQMKKNRPATLLRVLCRPAESQPLMAILFAETSTLGVRQQSVTRHCLARSIHSVETAYGPIRVKVAAWAKGQTKAAPEYEDCRQAAQRSGVPLREVYRAAEQAAVGGDLCVAPQP